MATKTLKGDLVAALYRTRLGRCARQVNDERCTEKTRIGIGIPVIDSDGLVGFRVCGKHIEAVLQDLR